MRLQLLFLYQMKEFPTSKISDPQHGSSSGQELASSNNQKHRGGEAALWLWKMSRNPNNGKYEKIKGPSRYVRGHLIVIRRRLQHLKRKKPMLRYLHPQKKADFRLEMCHHCLAAWMNRSAQFPEESILIIQVQTRCMKYSAHIHTDKMAIVHRRRPSTPKIALCLSVIAIN